MVSESLELGFSSCPLEEETLHGLTTCYGAQVNSEGHLRSPVFTGRKRVLCDALLYPSLLYIPSDEVKVVKSLSHVRFFATPWTTAYQPPPMGFSRQEYWSGLPTMW